MPEHAALRRETIMVRRNAALAVVTMATACLLAADSNDLEGYVSPEKAVTTTIRPAPPERSGLVGFLGVHVKPDMSGLLVEDVKVDSPAARAGIRQGDRIVTLDGRPITRSDSFREAILARTPGEKIALRLQRHGQTLDLSVELGAVSRPLRLGTERVWFGAVVSDPKDGDEGIPVESVTPESPAAQAGIKVGDVLFKIDGQVLRRSRELTDTLSERRPGDTVKLTLRRGDQELDVTVALVVDRGTSRDRPGTGRGGRVPTSAAPIPSTPWTKPVFRLAVVGVEFEDVKHNDKIPLSEWEAALFSERTYTKENATGQRVSGSLRDYFADQSYGRLRIEGKVFGWVQASKKRGDYSQGSGTSNRSALPSEAIDKLLAREGRDALNDFDGVFVIYAGSAIRTNPGAVYFPHAGTLESSGRRVPYVMCFEGGTRMAVLRDFCKPFGLMMGLVDLAARTENIGSEGVEEWCLMGSPRGPRPPSLCAWSKERLGWIQPAVLDPTVPQKIILAPSSSGPTQFVKVLVRPDGSEYFLLENRTRTDWDRHLPAGGLLIWRVVNNRPVLEESHGVEGSSGPRVLTEMIPFPSPANNSFTPYTTPSSRSARGGGLPVHITEIRRHPDGRISFQIGFEYQ
jgi:M6 family metalloprotease-like protein